VKTLYTAVASATDGGRNGRKPTDDGKLDVDVPHLAQADAEELLAEAHERCPYSNATRRNVPVELAVHGGAAVSA
jgi:osmotically inducible protein OsmC